MNNLLKKIIQICMVCVFCLMQSNIALAKDLGESNDKIGGFVVKDVQLEDVPDGVKVVEYNSLDEAYAYIKEVNKDITNI